MQQTILIEAIKKDARNFNAKITLVFLFVIVGLCFLTGLLATYFGVEHTVPRFLLIITGIIFALSCVCICDRIYNFYAYQSYINTIKQPYLIARLYFKVLPNRFWENLILKKLSTSQIYQKYKNPPVYTKLLLEEVRDYYENEPFLIFIALRILELELKLIQSNWHHVVKTPKSFTEKLKVVQEKMEQQENLK